MDRLVILPAEATAKAASPTLKETNYLIGIAPETRMSSCSVSYVQTVFIKIQLHATIFGSLIPPLPNPFGWTTRRRMPQKLLEDSPAQIK